MTSVLCKDRSVALVATLGSKRFAELAVSLGERLDECLAAIEVGAEQGVVLALRLHQVRGAAGTLGMLALAAELERLEIIVAGDGGSPAAASAILCVRDSHAAAVRTLTSALANQEDDHADARTRR